MWWVYVLRCVDGTLYCGKTLDVDRRLLEHNVGRGGAKYTRGRRPCGLVAKWCFSDNSTASKVEYWFKKLTRKKKDEVLQGRLPLVFSSLLP